MQLRQRMLHLAAVVSVLAALSAGPQVAGAQPTAAPATAFVVNSLADLPDANLGIPACDAGGGQCTFRAAVQQANAHAGPDSISFSVTGIITLTSATPIISETLTIVGPGPTLLTIDADGTGPVLWIFTLTPSVNLAVSGLTLTGGLYDEGGGVAFSGSTLVISDTVITNNVGDFGGGLSVYGQAQLINSTVSHNLAVSGGGGIYNLGSLEIINSHIQENRQAPLALALSAQSLSGLGGGGVYSSGQLTMTNSAVISNSASGIVTTTAVSGLQPAAPPGPFGGGLQIVDTTAVIQDSLIAGNRSGCLTCTVPAGSAVGPAASVATQGGGLFASNSLVVIQDSQVLSNSAEMGGGIMAYDSNMYLTRVLVDHNLANQAGGIASSNTYLGLSESTISSNRALSGPSGGVDIFNGNLDVSLTRIINNHAALNGGGLSVNGASGFIGFSEIEGNAAGSAVPVSAAGVEPQIASDQGGGLYVLVGELSIFQTAIVSNTATLGGGIASGGMLDLVNVTVSGNQARRDGGGIYMAQPPVLAQSLVAGGFVTVTTALDYVTLAGNVADSDNNTLGDGGGIFASLTTTPTLHNTLLGTNVDRGGQAPDCAGQVETAGFNLVQSTLGCTITATTGDQFNVAAGVLALGDYGGGTLTNALALDSLARDTADPEDCNPQDQRDVPRPFGAGCDIGAFELTGLFLPLVLR